MVLAKDQYGLRERHEGELKGAEFVEFTAQTRMSGVDLADGRQVRKGAAASVAQWIRDGGGTPRRTRRDGGRHLRRRRHAARRGAPEQARETGPRARSA